MVSKYDIFYIIALKGPLNIKSILKLLNRPKKDYQLIFNHVLELESDGTIYRNEMIKLEVNEKSKKLFKLLDFCHINHLNHNLLFKPKMLELLEAGGKREFFTINDTSLNPRTFKFNIDVLSRYGLLLIMKRKPVTCKLLRHSFINDLLSYFGKDEISYSEGNTSYIEQIKIEIGKYRRFQKISYSIMDDIEKAKEVNFIYSSLHLEGNPLTLPETEKLINENIVPDDKRLEHIQEVVNYKKAIDSMIENARNGILLDLPLVLSYHKAAMDHIHGAGVIRQQNVKIKGNPHFKTCNWRSIHSKLRSLFDEYTVFVNERKGIDRTITFAAFFHNEFQRIHPFIDGNSRLSRLLMLHILRAEGIPILDLPLGYYDRYMDLTKRSIERDDEAFRYMIEEMILFSIKSQNSML